MGKADSGLEEQGLSTDTGKTSSSGAKDVRVDATLRDQASGPRDAGAQGRSEVVPGLKESAQTPHTTRDGLDGTSARPLGIPEATQAARDADVKRKQEGGTFDDDGYPVADPSGRVDEHYAPLVNHLNAITDVGTLATVLAAVLGRCQAARVRPEILHDAVKPVASLKAGDAKPGSENSIGAETVKPEAQTKAHAHAPVDNKKGR